MSYSVASTLTQRPEFFTQKLDRDVTHPSKRWLFEPHLGGYESEEFGRLFGVCFIVNFCEVRLDLWLLRHPHRSREIGC